MSSFLTMDSLQTELAAADLTEETTIVQQHSSTQILPSPELTTQFLTQSSKLQDIFDLRLDAWEHSGKTEFVNRQLFPNGWFDELDASAFHWVTFNEQYKIVAAARLNIFQSLTDFPYYDAVKHLPFSEKVPFAFFSRLVVHPGYRNQGLSKQLYFERAAFCKERKISWSQVFINNPHVIRLFEGKGFYNIGKASVSYHNASQSHDVNVFIKKNNFD